MDEVCGGRVTDASGQAEACEREEEDRAEHL